MINVKINCLFKIILYAHFLSYSTNLFMAVLNTHGKESVSQTKHKYIQTICKEKVFCLSIQERYHQYVEIFCDFRIKRQYGDEKMSLYSIFCNWLQ